MSAPKHDRSGVCGFAAQKLSETGAELMQKSGFSFWH